MSSFGIIALTSSFFAPQSPTKNATTESQAKEELASAWLAEAAVALAAVKAGDTGIVNLEFADLTNNAILTAAKTATGALSRASTTSGAAGIKCDTTQLLDGGKAGLEILEVLSATAQTRPAVVLLALSRPESAGALARAIKTVKERKLSAFVEVTSVEEAKAAKSAGADAIIAKGNEAGGRVSEDTSFVLAQKLMRESLPPVYVQGGIGLHTAPACAAAGASGVVLDTQLLLARESALPFDIKQKVAALDGTETHTLATKTGTFRLYARGGQAALDELRQERQSEPGKTGAKNSGQAAGASPKSRSKSDSKSDSTSDSNSGSDSSSDSDSSIIDLIAEKNLTAKAIDRVYPWGQDIALAQELSTRFSTVAGIAQSVKHSVEEHLEAVQTHNPLAAGSPLAVSHGTRYALVQGAMTRVSDTAQFALKVAQGGGLPFLALALMRKDEVETLTAETKELLGSLPWGVGILGFVPQQLRQEQLEVLSKYRPPYALIAGGRPDQAKALEEMGIKTYLHVPSPMLLESFIEMGSRRFIFEGKECGGHVGPRSSFVLWEQMITRLLGAIGQRENPANYHVLFAGGVHDDLSAAMVATMAATLAQKGVRVGALMGTAYLFTEEAVQSGAIVERFQKAALDCQRTVLLETGPGHAIRCIDTPYKRVFDETRKDLTLKGKSRDEVREALELMNLGRLRIASKGLMRAGYTGTDTVSDLINESAAESNSLPSTEQSRGKNGTTPSGTAKPSEKGSSPASNLVDVSEEKQWADGMYMIGQVASMHSKVTTIEELHKNVAEGGSRWVAKAATAEGRTPVAQASAARRSSDGQNDRHGEPIAIIGMSCLFPKASDLKTYWENILNKVDTIEEVPANQWDWRNYYDRDPLARDKISSKWGGFLEPIKFDPTKYGIPPSSLVQIDPMQALILEVTRAALEDAGYSERNFNRQRTSVVLANAGHGPITALYSLRSMLGWKLSHLSADLKKEIEDSLPEWSEDSFAGYLGNVTAGRVANRFDLGGINFSIDAACASSLAALYVGVQDLRSKSSDVVFLCATDTHNQPGDYLSFSKTHAFSPRGRCRTFDATADGIVISEGMAMLVLKRLADAERDGDRIYAVIRGIGGSSDGRDLSLTAPRPAGQVLALKRAYEDAGIEPSSVTLIEAHGTGTVAGDKAEIEALKQVFERHGAKRRGCAVGSVKTMIGHSKAAAGLASMIKVAKALHHKVLPPTMGVTVPNPSCNFEASPFYINSELRPWIMENGKTRRAGVSAFGFGGTNFHAVLEEYVPVAHEVEPPSMTTWPAEILQFKARNLAELTRSIDHLHDLAKKTSLSQNRSCDALRVLAQANYLKQRERHTETGGDGAPNENELSLAIVATSLDDLIEKLQKAKHELSQGERSKIRDPRGIYFRDLSQSGNRQVAEGKVAFLMPGQGSQSIDMLKDLALLFPELRKTLAEADSALREKLEQPLTSYIYPPPAFNEEEKAQQKANLTDTHIAQPAIGVVDLAMSRLLASFNVKPDMVAGHSYGEYAALCLAGAMSATELFEISEIRGRILAEGNAEGGAMAAVSATAKAVRSLLTGMTGITLANINAPNQCVISGSKGEIEEAVAALKAKGLGAKTIPVSQAFHSPHMVQAQAPLEKALKKVAFKEPQIPVYANSDAAVYTAKSAVKRLAEHIVNPVDFVAEVEQMHRDGATIFVEVGPGSVLSGLAEAILANSSTGTNEPNEPPVVIATDRAGRPGLVQLLHGLAELSSLGLPVEIGRLFDCRIGAFESALKISRYLGSNEPQTKPGLMYMIDSSHIVRIDASGKPVETKATKAAGTAGTNAATSAGQAAPLTAAKTPAHKPDVTTASKTYSSPPANTPAGAQQSTATNIPPRLEPQTSTRASMTNNLKQNTAAGTVSNKEQLQNQSVTPSQPAHQVHYQQQAVGGLPPQESPPAQAVQMATGYGLPYSQPLMAPQARNVDQVMLQFQRSMLEMTNSFLYTQQQVMLAYLGARPQGAPGVTGLTQAYPQGLASAFPHPYQQVGNTVPGYPGQPGYQIPQPPAMPQVMPANHFSVQPPDSGAAYTAAPAVSQAEQPQIDPGQLLSALSLAGSQAGEAGAQAETETESMTIKAVRAVVADSHGDAGVAFDFDQAQMAANAAATSETGSEIDTEELIESLLDIVSQRTGYPPEMLDPTLDLEADLGIDSIKRVEILNSFRKILPQSKQLELESGIEELAGTKTLAGIIDWLRKGPSTAAADLAGNGNGNGNGNGHGADAVALEIDRNGGNGHFSHDDETNGNGHGNGNGNGHAGDESLSSPAQAAKRPATESLSESGQKKTEELDKNGKNGAGHDHQPTKTAGSGGFLRRGIVKSIALSPNPVPDRLPEGAIIIFADNFGAGKALSQLLKAQKAQPVLVSTSSRADASEAPDCTVSDLSDWQELQKLFGAIAESHVKIGAVINLRGLDAPNQLTDAHLNGRAIEELTGMFAVAKAIEPWFNAKKQPGQESTASKQAVVTASRLNGRFAVSEPEVGYPVAAGLAGFMKSLFKEWPHIHCKALDFARQMSAHKIAQCVMQELATGEPGVEVGYTGDSRLTLEVVADSLDGSQKQRSTKAPAPKVEIDQSSVILITGGARGITAELSLELAEQYKPTMILVGRMPLPESAESDLTRALSTPRDIKAALIKELERQGQKVTIAAVETIYQKLVKEREIGSNIERLRELGARVEYQALDVRDQNAFGSLIDSIYQRYGRLDGVIHGAGVIEDGYVKDKSVDSFNRVVGTKVESAFTLSRHLKLESLKFLILFSSVVGRTGNAGQTDYVTANEVVNKLATALDQKTAGRVASIMWGPWKGGMAQPELEGIFAKYGWAMIDPAAGRSHFIKELTEGRKGDVEVLLVAELAGDAYKPKPAGARLHQAAVATPSPGRHEFALTLNAEFDRFLQDHTFDGVPVMPMAFSLEFMTEAVQAAYPAYDVVRVRQFDIPSGIVFDTGSKTITLITEELARSETTIRVAVSLNTGSPARRTSFKAVVELAKTGLPRPHHNQPWPDEVPYRVANLSDLAKIDELNESLPTLDLIYGQWMFHGPIFQGIKEVKAMGATGVYGSLRGSREQECFAQTNGDGWIIDPILFDSAMQLAGVWARQYLDITVLPTGFKTLHILRRPEHGEKLFGRVFINPSTSARELTCELAIYGEDGEIVYLVEGLGGIGSKSLNRLATQPAPGAQSGTVK